MRFQGNLGQHFTHKPPILDNDGRFGEHCRVNVTGLVDDLSSSASNLNLIGTKGPRKKDAIERGVDRTSNRKRRERIIGTKIFRRKFNKLYRNRHDIIIIDAAAAKRALIAQHGSDYYNTPM